jgi:hypothetical protein
MTPCGQFRKQSLLTRAAVENIALGVWQDERLPEAGALVLF